MTLKLTYAGFNYVADVDGSYADANSLPTMIADTASNAVALTDDYGIDVATSTVYADSNTDTTTGNTETIANLTATIEAAESDGLSVLVRPLLDFTADATSTILTTRDGASFNGSVSGKTLTVGSGAGIAAGQFLAGAGIPLSTTIVSGSGTTWTLSNTVSAAGSEAMSTGSTQYADGDWRAYYKPTDITAFFDSYDTMIVAEAKAAQSAGAQLFDIGTELDQLTGPAYLSQWTKIIDDVKAVYHGKLTYSAISDDDLSPWQYGGGQPAAGTGDLTTQVSFWKQLDYIGIDEYAAISDANNGGADPDPTLAQLIAGWEDAPTDPTTSSMTGGLSLIQYYENISTTLNMPLLFTEIGYNSAPDAASQPFYTSSSTYDPTLQANLYKAFFTAWEAQGNTSLEGVYIWNWEPDPSTVGAGASPNWTPQGDTGSLEAVDAAYTAATACFAAGTRIATPTGACPVETLPVGALVLTAAGETARVAWLGYRHVDCRLHPKPVDVWPVRVRADAFAAGQPCCDLILSPDHAVFVDGVLIPVRYLLNGATIVQERWDKVTYWHVELPRHDVLLAEGMPCESYLDTGNRDAFATARGAGPAPTQASERVSAPWRSRKCTSGFSSSIEPRRAAAGSSGGMWPAR